MKSKLLLMLFLCGSAQSFCSYSQIKDIYCALVVAGKTAMGECDKESEKRKNCIIGCQCFGA